MPRTEWRSGIKVTKFLALFWDMKGVRSRLRAHRMALHGKTLFLVFDPNTEDAILESLITSFNDRAQSMTLADFESFVQRNEQGQKNEDSDNTEAPFNQPTCFRYSKQHKEVVNARRQIEVNDPNINKCIMLRNVSLYENMSDIQTELELQLGFKIDKLQRWKNQPMAIATVRTSDQVNSFLHHKQLYIGYNLVQAEPYNKYKPRQKGHFRQCKKCFWLNHSSYKCPNQQHCACCAKPGHDRTECRHRHDKSRHRCRVCRGRHMSDSLICPKAIKIRSRLGITLSATQLQAQQNESVYYGLTKNAESGLFQIQRHGHRNDLQAPVTNINSYAMVAQRQMTSSKDTRTVPQQKQQTTEQQQINHTQRQLQNPQTVQLTQHHLTHADIENMIQAKTEHIHTAMQQMNAKIDALLRQMTMMTKSEKQQTPPQKAAASPETHLSLTRSRDSIPNVMIQNTSHTTDDMMGFVPHTVILPNPSSSIHHHQHNTTHLNML